LSEHGFGLALLSDSKYGFSVLGGDMRMSLLRAPKSPDPDCDLGEQSFSYAVMPHGSRWQDGCVVAEAYKFNSPMLWSAPWKLDGKELERPCSLISIDDPNLVIETIKKAADTNELIVRLYECHGARGTARLWLQMPVTSARFTDLLEDGTAKATMEDGLIEVPYRPFQIITLAII